MQLAYIVGAAALTKELRENYMLMFKPSSTRLYSFRNLLSNSMVPTAALSARIARWNQGSPQGNLHHNSILIQKALQYMLIILILM